MKHGVEFASHEESNRVCGIPVPESEVPLDHYCRRKRLFKEGPGLDLSISQIGVHAHTYDVLAHAEKEGETRFHIKRRIKIGNVSRFIPLAKRRERNCAFQWMIYVEAPQWAEAADSFITRVRFHIDPSFAPNHVIDVTRVPFQICRFGWGEFTARVQLFYVDPEKNPRTDHVFDVKVMLSFTRFHRFLQFPDGSNIVSHFYRCSLIKQNLESRCSVMRHFLMLNWIVPLIFPFENKSKAHQYEI
jgi:hypothetical protein